MSYDTLQTEYLKCSDADRFVECVEEYCSWFYNGICEIMEIDSSLSSIADHIARVMSKNENGDDVCKNKDEIKITANFQIYRIVSSLFYGTFERWIVVH